MANYFTDRVVQYPGRVTMTPVSGETNKYDMSRSEGTVTTDGTPFNAGAFNTMLDKYGMHYGTCTTSAGTATKTVSCSGFALETGEAIAVYFAYGNTSTSQLKLNVNGTGAKDIYGIDRSGNTNKLDGAWEQSEVKIFVYDGNVFRLLDQNIITTDELSSLETKLGASDHTLYNILAEMAKSGTVLTATWIASSTSAVGVKVTNSITLPKGTYLVVARTPYISNGNPLLGLRKDGIEDLAQLMNGSQGQYASGVFAVQSSGGESIALYTSGSLSVTYDALARGSLTAIRIA